MEKDIEKLVQTSKSNVKAFIKKFVDKNFYTERYLDECVDIIGNNDLKKLDNMNINKKELTEIKEKNKREQRTQKKFAVIYEIFIRHFGATGTDLQSIGKIKHITKDKLKVLKNMGKHLYFSGKYLKGRMSNLYEMFKNSLSTVPASKKKRSPFGRDEFFFVSVPVCGCFYHNYIDVFWPFI